MRLTLRGELRALALDWSPLPLSSTNIGLVNNYLGEDREPTERQTVTEGLKPILRWSMRRYEGGQWRAYRPVVTVELIKPAVKRGLSVYGARVAVPVTNIHLEGVTREQEEGVPDYELHGEVV